MDGVKKGIPNERNFHTLICVSEPHMTGKLATTMKATFNRNQQRERERERKEHKL